MRIRRRTIGRQPGPALLGSLRKPQVGGHLHAAGIGPSDRSAAVDGAGGSGPPDLRTGVGPARSHRSGGRLMQDRPTATELLEAASDEVERTLVAVLKGT